MKIPAPKEVEELLPELVPESAVYVADEDLRVVYTNDEWSRFAGANEGMALVGPALDTNLLDNMSAKERERWESIYRLLLDGELSHYEEDFICSSPRERRIYRLRSTPLKQENGGTLLLHHTVRVDDKAEEREDMRRRLKALDFDLAQVKREYKSPGLRPPARSCRLLQPPIRLPLGGSGRESTPWNVYSPSAIARRMVASFEVAREPGASRSTSKADLPGSRGGNSGSFGRGRGAG